MERSNALLTGYEIRELVEIIEQLPDEVHEQLSAYKELEEDLRRVQEQLEEVQYNYDRLYDSIEERFQYLVDDFDFDTDLDTFSDVRSKLQKDVDTCINAIHEEFEK